MILSSAILSEDETSEMVTKCIMRTFNEGCRMLTSWREITKREYPGRQDLFDMIPSPCRLFISKISKCGCIITDTFNATRKFRRLLIEAITEIANKEEMTINQIKIFEVGNFYNILLHYLQMKTLMEDCYCFVLM